MQYVLYTVQSKYDNSTRIYTVSQKNAPTLKRYSSEL